jgi:hypothetical protein
MTISMTENVQEKDGPPPASAFLQEGSLVAIAKPWTFMVMKSDQLNLIIQRPGTCNILLRDEGRETLVGQLTFVLMDPEPLTESRKAAIRSNPLAGKAVRGVLECKNCKESIRAYVGLERVDQLEAEGFVWYENLKDSFVCSCGNLKVDLTIWRRNLHGFLGLPYNLENEQILPLYEKGALKNIHTNFAALLEEKAPEETFQKFIENNPVLLHQFSPKRLFFKAPILSLRKTDFAIVNHQHELILLELEKPETRLLKTDGNIHSELQHAIGQPREWLHYADEHRGAVLECIGVDRKEVGAVHAVVVAGRDAGYDPEHLRRLKGNAGYARVKVMTYDDLLANLGTLIRSLEAL